MFVPGLPHHVNFGVTNRCNANCIHCYSQSSKGGADSLDTNDIFEFINQFAGAGVIDLGITGGEPLLRKDIVAIVAHAVKRGLTAGISTNGYYASRTLLLSLQNAGLDRLQVSLDGNEKMHDELRGVPGLYRRAISALEHCGEIGIRRSLCFTANRKNITQLPRLMDLAEQMQIETLNVSLFVPTGRDEWDLFLNDDELQQLYRWVDQRQSQTQKMEITMHTAKKVLANPELKNTESFIGCQAGVGTSYVNSYGDVTPCVLLPLAVGNLKKNRFEEIWKHSPVIRDLQERRVGGFCGDCRQLRKCGGCRALAFQKYKNLQPRPWLAEDATCWIQS